MAERAQRSRLLAVKLATLAREHGATGVRVAQADFGLGAGLVAGEQAWVLLDESPERGLGPALAWSIRQGATGLALLAETGTGTLSRRAVGFRFPVEVWHVDGRTLLPAITEPLTAPAPLTPEHDAFRATIVAAGATPMVEHGVLVGEVAGLEVSRAVTDKHTGEHRLEVGIGAHDREAFRLLHGDRPAVEALAGVVDAVGVHRRPGAEGHPLNRLARSRALRAALVDTPGLIGASSVVPADPPVPRTNVKDDLPCVAIATIDGRSVAVVCSVGVDLDVVPFAVDARTSTGIANGLLVLRRQDDLRIQHELAALLTAPLGIAAVDAP